MNGAEWVTLESSTGTEVAVHRGDYRMIEIYFRWGWDTPTWMAARRLNEAAKFAGVSFAQMGENAKRAGEAIREMWIAIDEAVDIDRGSNVS